MSDGGCVTQTNQRTRREIPMRCPKCRGNRFKSVAMVNTSQGCSESQQYLMNWAIQASVLDDHPQCIIRRKACCKCGKKVRTMEVVIATEQPRKSPKWRDKKVATTTDLKAVKTLV